jgi:threonine dehydrogenase-like Zn-dependent dehydrogenase
MGISHGTEMLVFRGEFPQEMSADATLPALSGSFQYPLKYGYINVGIAENGKRVFVFYPHQDRFTVQPEDLIELPPELTFEDALFLANTETALVIAHDTALGFGEILLIVGQGVVGLMAAEIFSRTGAGRIITIDRYPMRRQASQQIGCLSLDPENDEVAEIIRELSGGRGVDAAINLSGSEFGLQCCLDNTAFSGTVVEASWYGSRSVSLSLGAHFHRRRLQLKSSQVSRINPALSGRWTKQRRYNVVFELLQEINPSKYITHRIPLQEANRAYRLLHEHPEQTVQVVLEP